MNEDELFETLWRDRWQKHATEFDGNISAGTLRTACFDMCIKFTTELLKAESKRYTQEEGKEITK